MSIFTAFLTALRRLLRRQDGVFYINGPDTLPTPLTHEEESDILSRLEQDGSLRSVLVEHNLRLVVYIAKKFENTGIGIEDLISIGTIGLIKAINTFRADKNIKLATYASRCIENEILMYIRKTGNRRFELSIDEPLNTDWDGNELLLSDVLGGDEDTVYRDLETEEEKRTGTDDHPPAVRARRRTGADAEGGGGSARDLAIVHLPAGEKDHRPAPGRDREQDIAAGQPGTRGLEKAPRPFRAGEKSP